MIEVKLKKKAALISLIVGMLMFVGKMGAFLITGSSAILSDALESIVHIIATAFVFFSLYLSLKPANNFYPYGYGKIEYFSAGFEGALIVVAALSILYYSIRDIIEPASLKSLDTGALIILVASVVNLILGYYLIRTGKKTSSLILIADGKHVLTDSFTSIAVLVGVLLVIFTGIRLIDPIVAILVALNILFTGYNLISKSFTGLMNRSEFEVVDKIAMILNEEKKSSEDWIDVHRFRYWKSGEKYFSEFHLVVPYYLDIEHAHRFNDKLDEILKDAFQNERVEAMIHFDSCTPSYCHICRKTDCKVRSFSYDKDVKWDRLKIMSAKV